MWRTIRNIILLIVFLVVIMGISDYKFFIDNKKDESENEIQTVRVECNHDENVLCTHLPLVVIETNGNQIDKNIESLVDIRVIDNSNGKNHVEDTAALVEKAAIKYRGASSFTNFDKKQYRIEFRKDNNTDKNKKVELLGMSEASDWVLNGPFLDRTLIRNRLLYSVSKELFSWAPDTRYCEVVLNGKYQGLYLMIEPVTNEEGRLNLTDFGLASGQTAYLIKRDRANTEENIINTYGSTIGMTNHQVSISFPTSNSLTKAQSQYIEQDISNFEKVLYSDNFSNIQNGYGAFIDIDSFVNYYILNEFALNTDAGYLSTYVYKDLDEKLKFVVWDFNDTFDNSIWEDKNIGEFYMSKSPWFDRLLQDRTFVDEVISKYHELRKGILSDEYLYAIIDSNISLLGDAVQRNFEIWGYTFQESLMKRDSAGNKRDPKSYDEAVLQLKNTITERGKFLDENIEMLYENCIN